MSFSNNLQGLRKENDLSQEQLADKLNVTRQAVSKWESGVSYPEMDKLIALSELFKCTLDELVQGKVVYGDKKLKNLYDKFHNKMSRIIAFAVGFIILGIAAMLFIEGLRINNNLETISELSVIVFFSFITVSVFCFVYFGLQLGEFSKKYKDIPMLYSEEEIETFNKKYFLGIALGVTIILSGIIVLFILGAVFGDDNPISVSVFMAMIAVAVTMFVYFGMQKEKYQVEKYNDKLKYKEKYESKVDKYCGIVMMVATMIYLILGFIFSMWHPGWIVFPIGGMLCGIISLLFED